MRRRLDAELVRRKIARSREQAVEMIRSGRVVVAGFPAHKPATVVEDSSSIRVESSEDDTWASRGAHKLIGALDAFGVDPAGKKVLDAGASTGGFTDVLLRRGAREVVAVDVGYGQLIWRLQNDPRVRVHDRTNVRSLTPEQIGGTCEMMVGDLSFISLRLVLPALAECVTGDLFPMVKPQFEVGKERLGSGGVVRSASLRAKATEEVAREAQRLGLGLRGVVASPLPGPQGNVEFFLWLTKGAAPARNVTEMVAQAVAEGPQ
ncbi:TlyA family RNA methyltransferase [Corynebacterium sp. zg-331]|uniref:TlyA family RNA methyltransferase n=1 Tax=unclassified Corynebacterium TaxID=2624378 RepID=UPI00128BFFF9|nr:MULTISPECIES: TlyA family RNA methyltransferase [unclassified Corynebacterium]MBC3185619.1 TlyA family RNA methyltransferase [Corynebacterium sp. zg-331]MPV52113.1 TlyA family rRNA (cytidine-2'-O)-methyltransferase [Corynebacterium sp. zg331]